jgi:hypothetical protein
MIKTSRCGNRDWQTMKRQVNRQGIGDPIGHVRVQVIIDGKQLMIGSIWIARIKGTGIFKEEVQ